MWTGGAVTPDSFGGGLYGTFGQDLQAFGSDLTAKKSWFFLDDFVVAMGAGITGNSSASIETIVENRNLHDKPGTAFTVDGQRQPATLGWTDTFAEARWAHLDGVAGYVFPGGADVRAARTSRTGSWIDINPYAGDTTVNTRPYLSLLFDHGAHPSGAQYCYLVLPNATREQTSRRSTNAGVTVLANTAIVQAIAHSLTGLTMANSFAQFGRSTWRSSGCAHV